MTDNARKSQLRQELRKALADMPEIDRHSKSVTACNHVASTSEFVAASIVMLFLSASNELDTAPLALKCWQAGKTVVVPKISWDQRRILPIEISSLYDNMTTTGPGIREPESGNPIPVNFIDLVIVPGLGFSPAGFRIGRGMGFFDRFLAQSDFMGISCGLGFEEQFVPELPVLDHDMPLNMLVTDKGIRRFSTCRIEQKQD